MRRTTVAIVDDQPILLNALVEMLRSTIGVEVVAQGSSVREALGIARDHAPDVLVIDPTMQGDVFGAITAISSGHTKIVAFSAAISPEYAVRSLEAGATAYVLKKGPAGDLSAAIEAVLSGETYISQGFASKVIAALRDESVRKRAAEVIRLTWREDQIVRLLLRGRTNKEIGAKLSLSEKTVKHYMSSLMQKLQARNRTEAVIAAQKLIANGSDAAGADGQVVRYQ